MKKLILVLGILVVFIASPSMLNVANAASVLCGDGTTQIYNPTTGGSATAACTGHYGLATCPPAPPSGVGITPPCAPKTASGLLGIIDKVFTTMFVFLVTIASFTLLYAAFLYVTSEGEQEKIEKAKKTIIYAVIALIVAALAFGAPRAIQSFITG